MPLSNSRKVSTRGLIDASGIRGYPATILLLWRVHIQGTLRRGLANELTIQQFIDAIRQPCRYCGRVGVGELVLKSGQSRRYNGLDRRDNRHGYTSENIVTCCKTCNSMKGQMTEAEFLQHIQIVMEHQLSVGTRPPEVLEPQEGKTLNMFFDL